MIKKELINFSKKHSKKALATALLVMLSASFSAPMTAPVMAASTGSTEKGTEGSTEKSTEGSTEKSEEKPDEEEKKSDSNILQANLGRVEFWEWKKLDQVKDAFGDNKYHPVMMISGKQMYNGRYAFISSYSNRNHVFLPTYTNKVNNFSNDFPAVPGNPESTAGGDFGYYGRHDNEDHSPAYYFDAEENYYMHLSSWGYKGMSREDFDSERFFTTGTSMGVPWMKVANWGPDNGRTMMYITFPDKELSGGEAAVYQPDGDDYYLYVRSLVGPGGSRSEATMCATHYEMFDESKKHDIYPQDVWHLVHGKHTLKNGPIAFEGTYWFLVGYNDSYENSTAYDKFGANLINGATDYSFFTMFRDHKASNADRGIEIIPQGSKSACLQRTTTDYYFNAFVGTPHLFTSINTQTVPEGKLFPMTAGTYMPADTNENGETEVSASEGLILPKGQVLTIDGGTVSVSCKLINNGKIVVKNGGTLIVKDGGCIMPYTKLCDGEGTIECNGGNVIIMEGGSIYGFTTGVSTKSNPYSQTNAPIRLTGGSTLINYGNLSFTYGVVDNGSKIENRKNGRLNIGYNRHDPLELNPNLSNYLSKSSPANYPQGQATIGLFPLKTMSSSSSLDSSGVVKSEKTATIVGSEDCHISIITPEY